MSPYFFSGELYCEHSLIRKILSYSVCQRVCYRTIGKCSESLQRTLCFIAVGLWCSRLCWPFYVSANNRAHQKWQNHDCTGSNEIKYRALKISHRYSV